MSLHANEMRTSHPQILCLKGCRKSECDFNVDLPSYGQGRFCRCLNERHVTALAYVRRATTHFAVAERPINHLSAWPNCLPICGVVWRYARLAQTSSQAAELR